MLNRLLKSLHTPKWLFVLLFLILILRIPSLFEPYSYGDEMIYLTVGRAIREGIPLYSGIHDNKPPLLYIIAAAADNLFWFKSILTLWVLATVFVFWKFLETLFPKNQATQKVATFTFAFLTTLPLLEGNIVNAELFMIGPIILGFYILFSKPLTPKNLFLAGVLFSFATLFKVPAVFDTLAIVFLWLATLKLSKRGLKKDILSKIFLFFLGFIIPITLSLIWYLLSGSLKEYISAAFLQNIGYLSSWRPGDAYKPFLLRNLPLIIRGVILSFGFLILYILRRKLSKQFIFVTAWLLTTLFAATLSERPYPHYLIQSVGPISILTGILFTQQKREQVFAIVPLFLAFLVPVVFHFWYYPTLPYYLRFVKFATGASSKEEYLESFGKHIPRNYKIANLMLSLTSPGERIFIWGEGSLIYALSKRLPPTKYVVDYHIKDFAKESEVISVLSKNPPNFIIVLPEAPEFTLLDNFLSSNYAILETIDQAQIWKLLSPRVRSLSAF